MRSLQLLHFALAYFVRIYYLVFLQGKISLSIAIRLSSIDDWMLDTVGMHATEAYQALLGTESGK
jgi:hypothetical protein